MSLIKNIVKEQKRIRFNQYKLYINKNMFNYSIINYDFLINDYQKLYNINEFRMYDFDFFDIIKKIYKLKSCIHNTKYGKELSNKLEYIIYLENEYFEEYDEFKNKIKELEKKIYNINFDTHRANIINSILNLLIDNKIIDNSNDDLLNYVFTQSLSKIRNVIICLKDRISRIQRNQEFNIINAFDNYNRSKAINYIISNMFFLYLHKKHFEENKKKFSDNLFHELSILTNHPIRIQKHLSYYDDMEEAFDHL